MKGPSLKIPSLKLPTLNSLPLNLQTLKKLPIPNLFAPRGNLLGMDMGSGAAKFLHLRGQKSPYHMLRAWTDRRQGEGFKDLVSDHIREFGYSKYKTATAIADEKAENYEFRLPKLQGEELETAIQWELKKAIASAEFIYHDLMVFQQATGVEVQCTVATKELVSQSYEQGKSFGLVPTTLETESAALACAAEAVFGREKCQRMAIVDMGYSSFRLIFIHSARVVFTRALYFGLNTLFDTLSKELGLTTQEASDLFTKICLQDDVPDDKFRAVETALQGHIYNLCEEFRRSEMFVREQKGFEDLHELRVCGGGGCFPTSVDLLSRQLPDKKIAPLNPFLAVKKLPKGMPPSVGPLWACAFGLSLRKK